MANLADIIEKWILRRLSDEAEDIVVLQRNELADELECAPSQISYVLSTRFTSERGFLVESRRGTGGYVRIARLPAATFQMQYDEAMPISQEEIEASVRRMRDNGLISGREESLILTVFRLFQQRIEAGERLYILRSLLGSLRNHS
ncbi:MAG: CtsR family transcriptional regulator [Sporomusaceae bacterium]|nr:CtsR family transcriptional regulator [Sporomusaceae bacterium]